MSLFGLFKKEEQKTEDDSQRQHDLFLFGGPDTDAEPTKKKSEEEKFASIFAKRGRKVEALRSKKPTTRASSEDLDLFGGPGTTPELLPVDPNVDADVEVNPPASQHKVQDWVNFLFGTEMASVGIKWEADHFTWSIEQAKEQWSNEPLWSLVGLGSLAATAIFPTLHSLKLGKLGQATGKGFQFMKLGGAGDEVAESFAYFSRATSRDAEIQVLKDLGYLSKNINQRGAGGKFVKNELTNKVLKQARAQAYEDSLRANRVLKQNRAANFQTQLQAEVERLAAANGVDLSINPEAAAKFQTAAMSNLQAAGLDNPNFGYLDRLRAFFDKNFANAYWSNMNEVTPDGALKQELNNRLDSIMKAQNFGVFGQAMELVGTNKAFTKKFYQHAINRIDPSVDVGTLSAFSRDEQNIFDLFWNRMTTLQQRMKTEGFLPDDAPDLHLIAMTRSGVKPGRVTTLSQGSNVDSALMHETLLHRKADLGEVWSRANTGNVQIDTAQKLLSGHINDTMLLYNYQLVRDLAMNPKFSFSYDDISRLYGGDLRKVAEAGLVSLDDVMSPFFGGAARMRRMLDKAGRSDLLGPQGELPYITKPLASSLTESGGVFDNFQMASIGMFEALTSVHKTAKTGFNPATHLQNILGNVAFLTQAGFNVLAPRNFQLMQDMTKAHGEIRKAYKAAREALGQNARRDQIMAEVHTRLVGKSVNYNGVKVDLGEFAHPTVSQLYEEGAFETAEAFGHMLNARGMLSSPARAVVNAVGKVRDNRFTRIGVNVGTDKEKSLRALFDTMTTSYMAEDIIPKMALYAAQRATGMSINSSARWVARKMPMYGTVGNYIRMGRKVVFPWATFPTEALRIVKNNMLDAPLAMLPWLHTSQMMQGMFSQLGLSPQGAEAVQLARSGLPFWAQKHETVVTEGLGGIGLGGGMVGGMAGLGVGAALGGPRGAAAGAAAGAFLGGGAAAFTETIDEREYDNRLRGAVLNWLPHTSFYPQIKAPGYENEELSLPGFEAHNISDLLDYAPAEPFAIIRPLIEILQGRGSFGQEVRTEGITDSITKTMAGYIGFVAPPWIQKYGFKVTTPDVGVMDLVQAESMRELDPTNVSRFLVDVGASSDSITGEPGNPILDMLLNNVGAWKSYPVFAETSFSNARMEEQHFRELRNYYSRQLRYHIVNNNEEQIGNILRHVHNTFIMENKSVSTAQEKWDKWIADYFGDIGRHPKLRHLSLEELEEQYKAASAAARTAKTVFNNQMVDVIKRERAIRALEQLQAKRSRARGRGAQQTERGR